MMTESNRSLDELPALIGERKKFEAWIAALEARRDATAPHVFERVRTDYLARLREVEERLSAHRSSILEEKTSLESRRSLLEAEEQLRRDERAELELRAHVGELVGEDSESAFGTVDEALAKMADERQGLSTRIDELEGFLNLPSRDEPVSEPGQATSRASADLASPPPAERNPTPVSSAHVDAPGGVPGGAAAAATATPVDINKLVLSEHSATFERTSGQMPDIDEVLTEPPGTDRSINPPAPTKGARLTPGGRFDELAFLSDVVGLKPDASGAAASAAPPPAAPAPPSSQPAQSTHSATPLHQEPPKSPLEGMPGGRPATATPPLASNVGNTPIFLRASGAISQTKTLKCTECGAMNYPTEWYCERCGAELAAL
jgi:hypothetical protein